MTTADVLLNLRELVDYPNEDLNVEIKGWLDLPEAEGKATLAKAIIAIANHGGGYVLLGFSERNGTCHPELPRPESLEPYSQDSINGIVQRYAEPAFHCSVHFVERSDTGLPHPVVVVPGGYRVPIRSKRGGPNGQGIQKDIYYVRRPGPASEAPQSSQEWDTLIRKCVSAARDEQLDEIREIVNMALSSLVRSGALPGDVSRALSADQAVPASEGIIETARRWETECLERWESLVTKEFTFVNRSPYAFGHWTATYALEWHAPADFRLADLRDALARVRGQTGWPPWWVPTKAGMTPYVYTGGVECWLALSESTRDPAHADFWRVSAPARLFLLRGYQEDSRTETTNWEPGTVFDMTLPVWRTGEVCLHASRLAEVIGADDAIVALQMRWTGLANRELKAWANPNWDMFHGGTSHQDVVSTSATVKAKDISERLPEVVQSLTLPLYEVFDLFSPEPAMFQKELARMRSRQID